MRGNERNEENERKGRILKRKMEETSDLISSIFSL
jgi:hypothetical protein